MNDKLEVTEAVFKASEPLSAAGQINATSTAAEADGFSPLINELSGIKVINTGTIDPYTNLWGSRPLKKQGKQFLKPYLPADESLLGANRSKLYASPKIVVSKIGLRCEAFYDGNGEYASIDTNCMHSFSDDFAPEYVLCWLNSALYNYTFECLFDGLRMAGGYLLYSAPNLRNTPIKHMASEEQLKFVHAGAKLQELHRSLNVINDRVRSLLTVQVSIAHVPARLGSWWRTSFSLFAKKFGSRLSLERSERLLDVFEKYAPIMCHAEDLIRTLEGQVDDWFYGAYELSPAQVSAVKRSITPAATME